MIVQIILLLFGGPFLTTTSAWTPIATRRNVQSPLQSTTDDDENASNTRRSFFTTVAGSIGVLTAIPPYSANALVKGVAPPPKKSVAGDKPKCTNVEECQALAEI
eukprot:scaffold26688_cov137-Cylindrotheca_fusiformis.AAC.1